MGGYFPAGYFPRGFFPVGYLPGGDGSALAVADDPVCVYTYQGARSTFLTGVAFTVGFALSDLFGKAVPAPGEASRLVVVDSVGVETAAVPILRQAPPSGTQILTAEFTLATGGSYLLYCRPELYGEIQSSNPVRIGVR